MSQKELRIMAIVQNSILLGLALSLSACGAEHRAFGGTINRGLESVHQPIVARTDFVFDVAASNGGISGEDAVRLSGWFNSLRLGYGDHIAVDSGDGYSASAARDVVATLAARYGLLLDNTAPVTAGELAPGAIRVVVSRLTARVEGCPDWSRGSAPEVDGSSSSNFGCASNATLAAMIANPADLVTGQAGDPTTNAATSSKAIKSYRDAPNTGQSGLKNEGTGK
jgi:pilus assembly protein CpaD